MAIKIRNWFYTITATANKKGSRLRNDDKPPQDTFENLTDSVLFKAETEDRAQEKDGILPLEEVVGHVVAATDTEAKANEAKPADHTLVPQTSQLPTVEDEAQTITLAADADYSADDITEVYLDPATTTRNRWIVRWKASFITWFQSLLDLLRTDITTNANDIATNAGNIATNTANIATNTGNISSNDTDISNLQATDTLVRGSSNDTTPGYLEDKIVSTTIDVTTLNDGGNEQVSLEVIRDESLPLLYVNSNNSQPGDGSILNPFMSVDRIIDRLDNTGDFTDTGVYPAITSATVVVQGGTYTTAQNIARAGISWFFETGSTLTYSGTGYLFDFEGGATGNGIFVLGDGILDLNNDLAKLVNMGTSGSADRFEWESTTASQGLYTASNDLMVFTGTMTPTPVITVKNELFGIISSHNPVVSITSSKIRWNTGFIKVNDSAAPYVMKINASVRRSEFVDVKMSRASGIAGTNTVLQLEGSSAGLLLSHCIFSVNGTVADTTGFIRYQAGANVSTGLTLSGFILYACEFATNAGTADITLNTGNTIYSVDAGRIVYTNGTNIDINALGTVNITVTTMPTF